MGNLSRAQQSKVTKNKQKKAEAIAEAKKAEVKKPRLTPAEKHKQAAREAFEVNFPHGSVPVDVSGEGLLCGLRAVALSWSSQLPYLEPPTLNELKKISEDPEVTALNAEKGLDNSNNFFIEQLANIVRIAGTSLSTPTYIQLCVAVQQEDPMLISWPLQEKVEHRLWIYNDNAARLSGIQTGILNHYQAIAPRPAPEEKTEDVTQEQLDQMQALSNAFTSIQPANDLEPSADDTVKEPVKDNTVEYFGLGPEPEKDAATIAFEKRFKAAFGDISYGKETLPSGNRKELVKVFDAYMLELSTGNIIRSKNTFTEVSIRVDQFRPYVKVTTMRDDYHEDHEYSSSDSDRDDEDEPPSDLREMVEACYTYQSLIKDAQISADNSIRGVRAMAASGPAKEALPKNLQADIDALPKATIDLIKKWEAAGEVPILLDIFHDDDFIEKSVRQNTPAWGQRFAQAMKHEKCTRLLIAGYADTIETFKVFGEFIARNRSPLAKFHLGKSRWIFRKEKMADIPDLQQTGFQRMVSFYNLNEYLTIMWITHAKEQEILKTDIGVFEQAIHTIRLVEVRTTTKDSNYYGFLKFEAQAFRPQEGDTFKLSFNENEDFGDRKKRFWTFKVVEPISISPSEHVCGIVTRPWDRKVRVFEADDPSIITLDKSLSSLEAKVRIEANAGNFCQLKYTNPTTVDRNITWSFDPMVHDPKDSPSTPFNNRWKKLLLGTKIDELTGHDFFHFARGQLHQNPQDFMLLDEKQQDAIIDLAYSPGGVKITQGPPGTGKTHTIVESCIPFALMPKHGSHLIFSPSNAGADKIALDVDERIQQLREDEQIAALYPHILDEENAYVVRLHSKASERQIRDIVIFANVEKPEHAKPPTFPEDIADLFDTLSESEAIVHEVIRQSKEVSIPGILDPRVKHLTLSVGARMLQSIGLWPDGNGGFKAPWAGFVEKHNRFRVLMMRKVSGKELSLAQKVKYGEAALALYTDILQRARIIVGTTAGVAAPGITEIVRDHVVAITADENGREVEVSMLPIFSARFSRDPGLHLVGDQNQLKPMPQVNQSVLVTAKQKELSLMKRFILASHPFTMLVKQYRMHSDIVGPASRFFYQGKLISAPDIDKRPSALLFRQLVKPLLGGNYSNALWIDVQAPLSTDEKGGKKKRPVYKVWTGIQGSKSCEFQAIHCINLAVQLIDALRKVMPTGKLAILTQYKDEKNLYRTAIQKMKAVKWEGVLNLVVDTISAAQGQQYEYVILDIVCDDRIGMLCAPDLVNVALTRARSGLVIVGPMNAISSASGDSRAIRDLKNHFSRSGRVAKLTNIWEYPPCKFYTPSDLNVALDVGLVMSALSTHQLLSGEVEEAPAPRPLQRSLEFNIGDIASAEVEAEDNDTPTEVQTETEPPVEENEPEPEEPESRTKASTHLDPSAIFAGFKKAISLPVPDYVEDDHPAAVPAQDTTTGGWGAAIASVQDVTTGTWVIATASVPEETESGQEPGGPDAPVQDEGVDEWGNPIEKAGSSGQGWDTGAAPAPSGNW